MFGTPQLLSVPSPWRKQRGTISQLSVIDATGFCDVNHSRHAAVNDPQASSMLVVTRRPRMPDNVRISVAELQRRMDQGENFVFLDSRNPQAWAQSDVKLPRAI